MQVKNTSIHSTRQGEATSNKDLVTQSSGPVFSIPVVGYLRIRDTDFCVNS